MARYWRELLVCGILSGSALLAQTSHRRIDSNPPTRPNVFEQLEKQATESQKEDRARQAAARQQRNANLAELDRELPRLIELAQDLRKQLNASDVETTLPVDLERQAQEVEQIARRIHKQIRSL